MTEVQFVLKTVIQIHKICLKPKVKNETFSGYLENISYENIRKEVKFPERKIAMLPF